jgi:hypothetical protein
MAFIAECTFCNGKVRVPDGAAGLSVPCPRCGNYFTLAESSPQAAPPKAGFRRPAKKKTRAPLAAMTGPSTPDVLAIAAPPTPAAPDKLPPPPTPAPLGQLPGAEAEDSTDEPASPRARWLNAWGVAALLLASVALPCAQVVFLNFLIIPLAALSVLAGLVGVLVNLEKPLRTRVLPASGAVVGLAVLVIACFWSEWLLGINARRGNEPAPADPNKQMVVGFGHKHSERRASEEEEWVDARQNYFQHGSVRVRVTSVETRRLDLKNNKAGSSGAKNLVIGLRLTNVKGKARIRYESWGSGRHAPLLTDDKGKSYSLVAAEPDARLPGQVLKALLVPGKPVNDLLVFEAPADKVLSLRLELPADAFGGKGALRLKIYWTMTKDG